MNVGCHVWNYDIIYDEHVGLVLHGSIEEELSPYVEENGHREPLVFFYSILLWWISKGCTSCVLGWDIGSVSKNYMGLNMWFRLFLGGKIIKSIGLYAITHYQWWSFFFLLIFPYDFW